MASERGVWRRSIPLVVLATGLAGAWLAAVPGPGDPPGDNVPLQTLNVAEIGVNRLIFNANAGRPDIRGCSDASPCSYDSGEGEFPRLVLQQAAYTGGYRVIVRGGETKTVVVKAELLGRDPRGRRTVSVQLVTFEDRGVRRWRLVPGSWRAS